jgi:ribonuclease HI
MNTPLDQKIYIITDSKLAKNWLENLAVCKVRREECHEVRRRMRRRQKHLFFILAPSHTGIEGNEIADKLAEEGSKAAGKGRVPPPELSFDYSHSKQTRINWKEKQATSYVL